MRTAGEQKWYEAWAEPNEGYTRWSCITGPNGITVHPDIDWEDRLYAYESMAPERKDWRRGTRVLVPYRFDTREQAQKCIDNRIKSTKRDDYDETDRWHVVEVTESRKEV